MSDVIIAFIPFIQSLSFFFFSTLLKIINCTHHIIVSLKNVYEGYQLNMYKEIWVLLHTVFCFLFSSKMVLWYQISTVKIEVDVCRLFSPLFVYCPFVCVEQISYYRLFEEVNFYEKVCTINVVVFLNNHNTKTNWFYKVVK